MPFDASQHTGSDLDSQETSQETDHPDPHSLIETPRWPVRLRSRPSGQNLNSRVADDTSSSLANFSLQFLPQSCGRVLESALGTIAACNDSSDGILWIGLPHAIAVRSVPALLPSPIEALPLSNGAAAGFHILRRRFVSGLLRTQLLRLRPKVLKANYLGVAVMTEAVTVPFRPSKLVPILFRMNRSQQHSQLMFRVARRQSHGALLRVT
jgi:hypothetical protein